MEIAPPARSALRSVDTIEDPHGAPIRLYELQGTIQFAGAESALRATVDDRTGTPKVAIDLTRVHLVNDVGRRMLLVGVRRLALEDREVTPVEYVGLPHGGGTSESRLRRREPSPLIE